MRSNKLNVLIFIVITIVISFFGIFAQILIDQSNKGNEKIQLPYKEKSNINYQVYLVDNPFFSSNYLTEDYNYIAALTDYIDTVFNYDILFDKKVSGDFSYYIKGTLLTKDRISSNPLWKETYILKNATTGRIENSNKLHINDGLSIDYKKYYNLVNKFIENYSVAVDATLDIELVVDYKLNYTKFDEVISEQKSMSISIPLSNITYEITGYNDNLNESNIFSETHGETKIDKGMRNIGYIMWTIDVLIILITIIFLYKFTNKKSKYDKKLHRILKNYNSVIINVLSLPELEKYNLIYVTDFEELVDLQSELRVPITFMEVTKDFESVFVIIHNSEAWVYILNLDDLNKKEKEIFKI